MIAQLNFYDQEFILNASLQEYFLRYKKILVIIVTLFKNTYLIGKYPMIKKENFL